MGADSRVVAVQAQVSRELTTLSPRALLDRRELVSKVIDEVMVEGLHYGQIPGTPDLSLLKEGAEVLLSTFQIAVEPIVTDLSTPTEVRFQVEVRGLAGGTHYVGSGMGVCSSNEEKYRWRKVRSAKEWDNTDPAQRRIKYGRDWEDKQVRQSPWDVFQTIMSMAKKRAMVDLAKTCLAASECLKRAKLRQPPKTTGKDAGRTQSKDPPKETGGKAPAQSTAPPAAKPDPSAPAAAEPASTAPATITAAQARSLYERMDYIGVAETLFFAKYEIGRLEDLPAEQYNRAQAWLSTQNAETF